LDIKPDKKSKKPEIRRITPHDTKEIPDIKRLYIFDKRNYEYKTIHWSFCINEDCTIHYHAKLNEDFYPKKPKSYRCTQKENH